ncbi:MAG: pyridoxamine 5'-phosphate oxidase family protein [Anaerolineae bacterium]
MSTIQGNISLLNDPIAQELLQSTLPAQLSYVWSDGSPRVVPIWFHWNGQELVLGSPPNAPKVEVLTQNPKVALTINGSTWPYKVLTIRGRAQVELVDGVSSEYASCARRYFGEEQGQAWVEQVGKMFPQMARITVQAEWVGIIDFEKRFPSAIESVMAG